MINGLQIAITIFVDGTFFATGSAANQIVSEAGIDLITEGGVNIITE
jgi:hypothetical protein